MSPRKKSKSRRPKSLSHGRPQTISSSSSSLSSRATRTLIRSHHHLLKQHAAAKANDDCARADSIALQIERQGGLRVYQHASLTGQSIQRGGDSSKVLMEWVDPLADDLRKAYKQGRSKLRILEVGSLSTKNACSRSGLFEVTRIDLNPQDKDILKQDFMKRPLPLCQEERFDVLSLSLVLNYVPDPLLRGEMLRQTTRFLRDSSVEAPCAQHLPALFLVLPAPCVSNSRYLNEERLGEIMGSFGYSALRHKITPGLAYSLWKHDATAEKNSIFNKIEVRSGQSRNNFAIVLK
ncbi:MAG: hypothetical protein M1837_001714 [Sclerophora amabilis]|nr:MAG: hypothetical protein M1837_001714 [Sclerophora amabilis]